MRVEIDGDRGLLSCTVEELASVIACEVIVKGRISGYDFAIQENDDMKSLTEIKEVAEQWFGVQTIHTRFDSNDLILGADYYGGGCFESCAIPSDMVGGYLTAFSSIRKMMLDCLRHDGYSVDADTQLMVEIYEEGAYV